MYNALDEYIFSIVRDNAPVRTDVYGISVYHVYRLINHSSHFHCSNRTEPIWLLLLRVRSYRIRFITETFPSYFKELYRINYRNKRLHPASINRYYLELVNRYVINVRFRDSLKMSIDPNALYCESNESHIEIVAQLLMELYCIEIVIQLATEKLTIETILLDSSFVSRIFLRIN